MQYIGHLKKDFSVTQASRGVLLGGHSGTVRELVVKIVFVVLVRIFRACRRLGKCGTRFRVLERLFNTIQSRLELIFEQQKELVQHVFERNTLISDDGRHRVHFAHFFVTVLDTMLARILIIFAVQAVHLDE